MEVNASMGAQECWGWFPNSVYSFCFGRGVDVGLPESHGQGNFRGDLQISWDVDKLHLQCGGK